MSYYSFIKEQSPAFQDETLGKRVAGKLRSGEINSKNFGRLREDQLFRPLTLEQLIEKQDLAF